LKRRTYLFAAARVCILGAMFGLGALVVAPPADARSFADILGSTPITRPLADALTQSIARSIPVPSVSPAYTYSYNPETDTYERQTALQGQLFLERPDVLGAKVWNVNVSYQWVKLDTVDGKDLGSLSDTRLPIVDHPPSGPLFIVNRFAIDFVAHEVVGTLTYGLRDDLDVSITVPLIYSRFGLDVVTRRFDPDFPGLDRHSPHDSAFGVGDVFLRAKYLFRGDYPRLAAGLVLRLPAGDEENFLGTGDTEVTPLLYASTPPVFVASRVRLQGYVNAGVGLNASDVADSEGLWGVGIDCQVADRFTLAVAALGRQLFERQSPPGVFDLPRCPRRDASQGRCLGEGEEVTAPFLGLHDGRPDFFDLSVGVRVNLWRDRLMGFANALLPLNDDGFRADVIPLVGIEMSF